MIVDFLISAAKVRIKNESTKRRTHFFIVVCQIASPHAQREKETAPYPMHDVVVMAGRMHKCLSKIWRFKKNFVYLSHQL